MEPIGSTKVPGAFIWRRIHSLMGFWLVIYLIEHLTTNSQAALWIGDDGHIFVRLVNFLHNLPYLQVIEIVLLGIPFAIHILWGIKIMLTGKGNAHKSKGNKPSLSEYGRNRAYTWQRVTAWILIVGVIGHVIQMRFLDYPVHSELNNQEQYLVKLNFDQGLYTLSDRLDVKLYNASLIAQLKSSCEDHQDSLPDEPFWQGAQNVSYNPVEAKKLVEIQNQIELQNFVKDLSDFSLYQDQIVAAAPNAGTAMLLGVRDTFKSPLWIGLYTIFVLAAAFHAFNGLWTFLITWGAVLSMKSQKSMVSFCIVVMLIFMFLGLAAIWGTYWVNLRN